MAKPNKKYYWRQGQLRKLVAKEEEDFRKYNNMCHLCKNFEHKTSYDPTYNCHPYETAVSAYDFCTDFTVDKTKVKTRNTKLEKLQM